MKTATLLLLGLGVVGVGGGAYLVLRKRKDASKQGARDLGAEQSVMGGKAVQMGIPVPPPPPGKLDPSQTRLATVATVSKGGAASADYTKMALGLAGAGADLLYPGVGTKAANVLKAVDSKVGNLVTKVPGVNGGFGGLVL